MNLKDYTRANEFDRVVGKLQTELAIEYGVGNSVLDIGCGIGEYTQLFWDRFQDVWGLDPDERCLKEAKKNDLRTTYVLGYGETFKIAEKFDTISMNNILEHVDDPVKLLMNCKQHLKHGGRIIVQVPNSESITRRLGVLMGLIPSTTHISEKEANFWGHKRTYNLDSLESDCMDAGLDAISCGGLLYKPLPNEVLWDIYNDFDDNLKKDFIDSLVEFGKDRPDECACLYAVCE